MILTYYTPYATLATLQRFCWYPWRNQKKALSLHLDFERGKEVPIYK